MGRYVWPEYLFLTLRLCYWISFIQNPHTCVHSCIMSCTQFYIYKEEQISHGASGRKWWSFSEREARTTKQQQLEETPTSVWEGQPKRPTFPELFLQSADGLKIGNSASLSLASEDKGQYLSIGCILYLQKAKGMPHSDLWRPKIKPSPFWCFETTHDKWPPKTTGSCFLGLMRRPIYKVNFFVYLIRIVAVIWAHKLIRTVFTDGTEYSVKCTGLQFLLRFIPAKLTEDKNLHNAKDK